MKGETGGGINFKRGRSERDKGKLKGLEKPVTPGYFYVGDKTSLNRLLKTGRGRASKRKKATFKKKNASNGGGHLNGGGNPKQTGVYVLDKRKSPNEAKGGGF